VARQASAWRSGCDDAVVGYRRSLIRLDLGPPALKRRTGMWREWLLGVTAHPIDDPRQLWQYIIGSAYVINLEPVFGNIGELLPSIMSSSPSFT
jgi:hypothetical protein